MSDDDLTTAYMVGFHKRDDEVAALKAEIERLQGLVGLESADLDLDWNRLRSGDLRALNPDHQDVFNMVFDLQAEIERLRAHIAELDWKLTRLAWQAKGEAIIQPAAQWGPGGNVMVQSSVLFKLGAWWADRPWRVRRNPPTGT